MNKSTNFTGQPILAQLLSLIDKSSVSRIAKKRQSDRCIKYFKNMGPFGDHAVQHIMWGHSTTRAYNMFYRTAE